MRRFVVLCASLLLAACGEEEKRGPPPVPETRSVHVAVVASAAWPRALHVVGTLEAHDSATLATKVQGRLQSITVDVGARVKAGDPVARLETVDLSLEVARAEAALGEVQAQLGLAGEGSDGRIPGPEEAAIVKLARAQLDEARANHERSSALRTRGIATQAEWDAAEAALRAAQSRLQDAQQEYSRRLAELELRKAELALARQRLADAEVPAPFAGVVRARHAAPGDVLAPGSPVATLVRVDPLRLRAEVPEREAALVKVGQRVLARVEGLAAPVEARLVRVSPALEPATRMLAVEADVPNPEGTLRAGSFCRVELIVEEAQQVLAVPPRAVRSFAGLDKVLVVDGSKAVERRVSLGRREAERVEVLAGLQGGERVVLDPGGMPNGAPVRVEGE